MESNQTWTLNKIFEGITDSGNCVSLPISHLLSCRTLKQSVENGFLEQTDCKVFNRKLIYLSYGGVFHRYGYKPTSEAAYLPAAILFKPSLLRRMDCFFPYDTGAAKKERYGLWSHELCKWENYRVHNRDGFDMPAKIVHFLYGKSESYLDGEVSGKTISDTSPCSEILTNLIKFLREDLTSLGVDYRQRTIECQTTQPMEFKEIYDEILWIALPEEFMGLYYDWRVRMRPSPAPRKYFYKWRKGRRPLEIASILEDKARDIINEEYLDLERYLGEEDVEHE